MSSDNTPNTKSTGTITSLIIVPRIFSTSCTGPDSDKESDAYPTRCFVVRRGTTALTNFHFVIAHIELLFGKTLLRIRSSTIKAIVLNRSALRFVLGVLEGDHTSQKPHSSYEAIFAARCLLGGVATHSFVLSSSMDLSTRFAAILPSAVRVEMYVLALTRVFHNRCVRSIFHLTLNHVCL